MSRIYLKYQDHIFKKPIYNKHFCLNIRFKGGGEIKIILFLSKEAKQPERVSVTTRHFITALQPQESMQAYR